jgi:hypothetical protein
VPSIVAAVVASSAVPVKNRAADCCQADFRPAERRISILGSPRRQAARSPGLEEFEARTDQTPAVSQWTAQMAATLRCRSLRPAAIPSIAELTEANSAASVRNRAADCCQADFQPAEPLRPVATHPAARTLQPAILPKRNSCWTSSAAYLASIPPRPRNAYCFALGRTASLHVATPPAPSHRMRRAPCCRCSRLHGQNPKHGRWSRHWYNARSRTCCGCSRCSRCLFG